MAGPVIDNPLTPQDVQRLRDARVQLNTALLKIQQATECGLDCRAEQAMADQLADRVDRMLNVYGGGGGPRA